jgi:hypothetical protein
MFETHTKCLTWIHIEDVKGNENADEVNKINGAQSDNAKAQHLKENPFSSLVKFALAHTLTPVKDGKA